MDNSPIIDFYPVEFKTDLNGKQQEWEAVVLIPFINEVCEFDSNLLKLVVKICHLQLQIF